MMHLNRDELHVWLARLEVAPQQLVELKRSLSPDELERADNFYFERDRRSFIAARGILRTACRKLSGDGTVGAAI